MLEAVCLEYGQNSQRVYLEENSTLWVNILLVGVVPCMYQDTLDPEQGLKGAVLPIVPDWEMTRWRFAPQTIVHRLVHLFCLL